MAWKVYIAGPITKDPDYLAKFDTVENELKRRGFDTFNPAMKNPGDHDYKWYIDRGLKALSECDAICLIEGWSQSVGATLEYTYSKVVDMPTLEARADECGIYHISVPLPIDKPETKL